MDNKPLSNSAYNDSLKRLIVGNIYTIIGLDGDGVLLKEVKSSFPTGEYRIGNRFRPLLTDSIEYAEKLINEIETEINEEQYATIIHPR